MVDPGSFENCYGRKVIEGSNPSASADNIFYRETEMPQKSPRRLAFQLMI